MIWILNRMSLFKEGQDNNLYNRDMSELSKKIVIEVLKETMDWLQRGKISEASVTQDYWKLGDALELKVEIVLSNVKYLEDIEFLKKVVKALCVKEAYLRNPISPKIPVWIQKILYEAYDRYGGDLSKIVKISE